MTSSETVMAVIGANWMPMDVAELMAATGLTVAELGTALAPLADAGKVILHADHADERTGVVYVKVNGKAFTAASNGN